MALPQRDKLIDEIHRLEGLMAYAESHGEWERLEELKARLKAAIDRMPEGRSNTSRKSGVQISLPMKPKITMKDTQ